MGGWPGSTLKKKQIKKLIVPSERDLLSFGRNFVFVRMKVYFLPNRIFNFSRIDLLRESRIFARNIFKA